MNNDRKTERGQAIALFAILMPVMSLFALGILDYMVTNARMMEAVAAADLAAHAGAQEIRVYPDGSIQSTGEGEDVSIQYFSYQRPEYVQFSGVSCGEFDGRPGCRVSTVVQSAGILIPKRWIGVNAIGYLAYGVTRDDQ